ncbi:MAG TPA: AraC family transcriptional regulator [Steroidobacteraceae bacterium]|nr:AraC family transcriptional regulator [Steroidobacteraceae bacterium]
MSVGVRADLRRADTRQDALAIRRWSTQDVAPREALAYWRDCVCQAILELGVECPREQFFQAQLDQCALGPATLNFVQATTQRVARTRRAIARSRGAVFHLVHLRTGQFELEHARGATLLHAGDCVLVDSTAPHAAQCPVPTGCLIVQFPQAWLRAWLPAPEDIIGRALRPQHGWSSALAAALATLRADDLHALSLPRGVVAEQLAALLALTAGRTMPQSSCRDQLHARIVRTLHDRYYEASLSPAVVALAHGISKRYLHLLFARAGTTFGEQLLAVRLQRARQLLSDDRFADVPIGELAARCGFAEPSYFARCFRRRFSSAPGAYRTTQQRAARPLALRRAQEDDATIPRADG